MGSRILIHNLGYPRMGALRQLKKSLEAYWQGKETEADLHRNASGLRRMHWSQQKESGVDLIPSNDFSYYDHVLDTTAMVGAVPERFKWKGPSVDLPTYFAMARGKVSGHEPRDGDCGCHHAGIHAMEMTKWFDTNYHYIVPEFREGQKFSLASMKVINEFQEAFSVGIKTKPVLLGPVTYLKLGKIHGQDFNRYDLLPGLVEVYIEVLRRLVSAKAEWVQFDEPALALDLTPAEQGLLRDVYAQITKAVPGLKFIVATYFNSPGDNLATFAQLPVQALHVDATNSGKEEVADLVSQMGPDKILSLGVVHGRNIWRNDYTKSLETIRHAVSLLGEDRVWIAPSCSLLFVPFSLRFEQKLNPEIKSWLAYAEEKLVELSELRQAYEGKLDLVARNRDLLEARAKSSLIHLPAVKTRSASITEQDLKRQSTYPARRQAQEDHLHLPELPTTTIGSFPQTEEVRAMRAQYRNGKISEADYEAFLEKETTRVVKWQDEIGLDVLVHGEYERTDMVEYFGEQLSGFVFTEHGWVQSYGSRCVKPPILFGDVERPHPMTVRWAKYAQAQTKKPMKGMLTGPITILQWSFVRNDQTRAETAKQIALAIRDEVRDLEAAGISVIQVDEPALREGLPLRRADWSRYLHWSVDAFRLATAGVADRTQIHTHMCYCEFNDIIESIAAMDADVISIESSRSEMELLEAFRSFKYPNEVGPGIWDIHSPRVPSIDEISGLLLKAGQVLPRKQIWVNPDCGLKTRAWPEVKESLGHMVAAALKARAA